jgi:hypothetical protein
VRGRGVDFEQRFRTSRWAEDLLLEAIRRGTGLIAVRFGASTIRSPEELARLHVTDEKEPDLLVFEEHGLTDAQRALLREATLEHTDRALLEPGQQHAFVYEKALAAVEVEFSPYRAREMKGRNWRPRTREEWERRPLRSANPPTAPNIWIKDEDFPRLEAWEKRRGVPIVVAHLFDQEGFAIVLSRVSEFRKRFHRAREERERVRMQVTEGIFCREQRYGREDADGASEQKRVFVVTPNVAMCIGTVSGVRVRAQKDISASRKYVSRILFSGGRIALEDEFLGLLRRARQQDRGE